MRTALVLLLLLNYLTVVLAGSWTALRAPAPTEAHPYAHSAECQRQNYLRLDCFDACNGQQLLATKLPKGMTDQTDDSLSLKMLDCHLPAAALPIPPPAVFAHSEQVLFRLPSASVITILLPVVGPPPETSLAFAC